MRFSENFYDAQPLNRYIISTDKSLEKAEKRHFKLYIKRSSGKEDLKIVHLFDALDKLKDYDEKALLKKLHGCDQAAAGQSENPSL